MPAQKDETVYYTETQNEEGCKEQNYVLSTYILKCGIWKPYNMFSFVRVSQSYISKWLSQKNNMKKFTVGY